jgi:hypothetical protein
MSQSEYNYRHLHVPKQRLPLSDKVRVKHSKRGPQAMIRYTLDGYRAGEKAWRW